MNEYRWHDAAKDKPEEGKGVLVCFSGIIGVHSYHHAYSIGCYHAESGAWETQEFGYTIRGEMQIHGWKEIEPFALEG